MKKRIELLAPGGDVDAIKAAIIAGADAVYCGLDKFNARNRAGNINLQQLSGILSLAHQHNCAIFITLNIIIVDSEIPDLVKLLNKLVNTSIDGIIIQDLGLFYLLNKYFPSLKIHASTQLTTHNEGQLLFLNKLKAERVNFSRELSIMEIKSLSKIAHENNLNTEVFVHGSNCLSFSGACYLSSVMSGNSGNRGRCNQACRDQYQITALGNDYPLNLKDLSAFHNLKELAEAGADSLKIEGRIKKSDYVYTVVNTWRQQLDSFEENKTLKADNSIFYKVFNRDFSNNLLMGNLHKEMFIDDPRDHSVQHLYDTISFPSADKKERATLALYDEKEAIKTQVNQIIAKYSIEKKPLKIIVSGQLGSPLKIKLQLKEKDFELESSEKLRATEKNALNEASLLKRLKALNETEYEIVELELIALEPGLFIPFKELSALKSKLLFYLMDSKELIAPIEPPILKKQNDISEKPQLSILISSPKELDLFKDSHAILYFQLPNSMGEETSDLHSIFKENKKLIPWFPSILIGEDFRTAVEFLEEVKPQQIVTNNSGIAMAAYERNIPWIAGPYMNLVNSYSLLALKENFDCVGAFISNEINKEQVKRIQKPDNFQLFYSIFHPMELMTTRQCLFHQTIGCEKNKIDHSCISHCQKKTSITNLKGDSFLINKSKGNLHHLYYEKHYLNTDIVNDFSAKFSNFMIDLREIKTQTQLYEDPLKIVELFEQLLLSRENVTHEIHQNINPSCHHQYIKGI